MKYFEISRARRGRRATHVFETIDSMKRELVYDLKFWNRQDKNLLWFWHSERAALAAVKYPEWIHGHFPDSDCEDSNFRVKWVHFNPGY